MEARNSLTNFNQIYFMQTEQAVALQILMNDDLYLTPDDLFWKAEEVQNTLLEEPAVAIKQEAKPAINFFGKNLKNFLILTEQQLNDNQLNALENTLARKQMSFDDVAVVDFSAHKKFNIEDLYASFMPQKLVCFGLKAEDLGLPEATLNEIYNQLPYKILYTYSFTEMLGNKDKTKAFWEAMKAI